MRTKSKTFDCVEMKNRIQAERLAEYEAGKDEFSSYLDFVNARVKDAELANVVRQKMERTEARQGGKLGSFKSRYAPKEELHP